MKKIILGIVVLVIVVGGYIFYQNQTDELDGISTPVAYYQGLKQECNLKEDKECCLASVEGMKSDGAAAIDPNTGICNYGYKREMLLCVDSFAWCKPLTINETNKEDFYQSLKDNCEKTRTDKNQLSCCLDSVKTMEIVGSTKLFPGGKYEESGEYDCGDGLIRMTLRCPGSYAWCQTSNNPEGEDFIPVPMNTPRVKPKQSENPRPGFDSDGNGPICTLEAKQCPDGTYVGREGPNCEFAKCPGKTLKSDTQPIDNLNEPIKLPDNALTEKECTVAGGEVWNTLGETSYNGELIGKIEGLNCPCACLVRNKRSDKIWVNVNGNIEEFKGDLDDIKTFDDCKKAGFKVKDGEPKICTVGEPYMTGGKYKTFYNNPMESGKTCEDYTYSNCPGSCVPKCIASSCSEPDENGAVICTSDCDGVGSCVAE